MKSLILDKILETSANKYDFNTQKIIFILPSRRSIYYSKNYLKNIFKQKNKSSIFPEFLTPDELIEKITELTTLSKVDLFYYLYISYKKVFKESANSKENYQISSYSSFIKWAPTLLNDFNDVLISHPNKPDKQKSFFTNLKDIKEIEHWSLSKEPLSESQKKYLKLMENFYTIFQKFNHLLLSFGWAYAGLNYQKAVEIIEKKENNDFIQNTDKFIFIGLNALSQAEKIIYKHLKDQQKAEFYWDYDIYYTENEKHEAGKFLRENFKTFEIEEINKQSKSYFDNSKNITIASATNDVEEALFIKKTLEDLNKQTNSDLTNTTIILNAPEKLNLILSAIPENIEYNVSLEYPLFLTPAYQLLIQILSVFIQHENDQNKKILIYYKNFISILLNPYFKSYIKKKYQVKEKCLSDLVKEVQRQNKIYISITTDRIFSAIDEQCKYISEFFQIFQNDTNIKIIESIYNLFNDYKTTLLDKSSKDVLTINILNTICEQLSRIKDILKKDEESEEKVFEKVKDLYALITQILGKEGVALQGEPLKGVQIIGLLESRLLSFDNLIIPFMNEGIFPPDHHKVSFIPYDLKYQYQLPTHHHLDAISSYLFYRNLHSPTNIYLSYNNSEESNNSALKNIIGEQSRYIQQIKYELFPKKQQNINLNISSIQTSKTIANEQKEISIPKDDNIIQQLKQLTYSPSSITTYLDCSLKFYFQYVLKLREEKEVSEDLESDVEGIIFHEIMRELYEPYINKTIDIDKLNSEITNGNIKQKIEEKIQNQNLELKGKTLIKKEILYENIKNLLSKEIKWLESQNNNISIVYIEPERGNDKEKNEQNVISLNLNGSDNIKIYGIPDRIDCIKNENLYRIVDYKSSFDKKNDIIDYSKIKDIKDKKNDIIDYSKIKDIKDIDNIPKGANKLLQLIIYIHLNNKHSDNAISKNKNTNKLLQLIIYIYYAYKKNLILNNENNKITGVILPLKIKNNDGDKDNNELYQSINPSFNTNDINQIGEVLVKIFTDKILNQEINFEQTKNTNICKYCPFNYICKREIQDYSYY